MYNGEEVCIYEDKVVIKDKTLPAKEKGYVACKNGVLFKCITDENNNLKYTLSRFDGNSFVLENFRYENKDYLSPEHFCSTEDSVDGVVKVAFVENGTEHLFEFDSEDDYYGLHYSVSNDVLVLAALFDDGLLFYTKTGERLWEYAVKEGHGILPGAIVVMDDVVVITCKDEKGRLASAEGYNLLTGEKLWEITDRKCLDHAYTMGPDKMLYALTTVLCEDHTHELQLDRLNPFTGEVEVTVIEKGEYWTEIWPWNTTIYGNKLFYTNLLRSKGPSFGVIDLDTKKIIEDIPLNVTGYQIETPIVTDEKIYVRVMGLNELRIYKNEY